MNNISIYLTGHKGYIGSKLLKHLEMLGANVQTCDLKAGQDVISHEPKERVEVVYHLAAQSGVPESTSDPINDARQNILGTLKAIEIANKNKAKLIFTTSGASLKPESPYGLSKKTCEDYIKMLCKDYVILRLSSVYGHKPKGVVDNFVRDNTCVVYGDGSARRDFVHVDDIIMALLKAKNWKRGTYLCGSGKGTTIAQIAEATGKPVDYQKKRKGDKDDVVLKNTTPDWRPSIDVITWIKQQ